MGPQDQAEEAPALADALARIAETEELLMLAQEAGRIGIFEWQVSAGTVRLSPRFLAIYGLAGFDGRYESWLASIHGEDRPRVAQVIEQTFATRERQFLVEFRIGGPADETPRWIESRNVVLYAGDGKAQRVVGVNVDITERKRESIAMHAFTEALEEAVKERTRELEAQAEARKLAEDSLRQAQKMEVIGQLTGGVAHDFNNLLTLVLGGLDVIGRQLPALGDSPAAARIARAREMAFQGAQRAATLTSRLLAFSRLQPLAPTVIDANRLVASVCELLRRTLSEAVALETVLADGLWRTHADENQLENALLNLALNARDAMPDGGRLTIETANRHLDEAYMASLAEPVSAGPYVLIAVSDTGTGMDRATLEHAIEPFFTTKGVGRGTGLGLSQVYGFVRQSSGHMRIQSEPGKGTSVNIYLPRHVGDDPRSEAPAPRPPGGATGAETILVVEDDAALRSYTVESLRELGYRVLEAGNGAEALTVVDDTAIDLLFTDVVMPGGLNGRQLADAAVERRPGLKVLFTSGYTRNAIVHQGRLDPGVHMIGKPFSFADLGAKVRALLDGHG